MSLLILLSISVLFYFAFRRISSKNSLPLPPGPPSTPIIGHLPIIPLEYPEIAFQKFSEIYGDVVYLHVPGRKILVLNSVSSALDLLEQRGVKYSNRPRFTMLVEMMGWGPTLTLMPYGKRSIKQRKMFQQYFASEALQNFQPFQTTQAIHLAKNLISEPAQCEHHVKRYIATLIMKFAFGHEVTGDDDEYITMAKDVSYTLDNSGAPGATPPDLAPVLKHIPSWLPFASFASFAHKWRATVRKIHDYPFDVVEKQHKQGTAAPSFISHALQNLPLGLSEAELSAHVDDIKGVAANIFCAGNDPTFASILIFILAISMRPEVQERAQKELDDVIGKDRLPTFQDRAELPFVECVVEETLRWHPVLPLGIPRRSVEDDTYRGYHIPSGTVIIGNAYAMAMDDKVYRDPSTFSPKRFLPKPQGSGEPYFSSSWGFGRRVCPGKPLADGALWIAVATLLATVKIHPRDPSAPPPQFSAGGITSYPENIDCNITPRSEHTNTLLHQEFEHGQ